MPHGARGAVRPAPRPNVGLARSCEECLGWGTVVTDEGRHELCPACQCRAFQVGRAQ
jgi:hypothetical protein